MWAFILTFGMIFIMVVLFFIMLLMIATAVYAFVLASVARSYVVRWIFLKLRAERWAFTFWNSAVPVIGSIGLFIILYLTLGQLYSAGVFIFLLLISEGTFFYCYYPAASVPLETLDYPIFVAAEIERKLDRQLAAIDRF